MRREWKNRSGNSLKAGLILTGLMMVVFAHAQKDLVRVLDLEGKWKFSIGDREEWYDNTYNDEEWENVYVPSSWEDQGFYGYNGYGVYRKTFTLSSAHKNKSLYLVLGWIDDVDETYLNGRKIGSTGGFPPNYHTAYDAKRIYMIPSELLNYDGNNTIVVKVYDSEIAGGIISGSIGLYSTRFDLQPEINLSGVWKFKIGDNLERKGTAYNDKNWDEIIVPGKWEDQGYRDYDGFAWYRRTFSYSGQFTDEKVVLVLGKIDDLDEVYINGTLVGGIGKIESHGRMNTGDQYKAFRGYYIPRSVLKKGQNTIAVRVFDRYGGGGIYEGPIGILSQGKYIQFWREMKSSNR